MRPASAPALSWAEASSGSDGSVSVPTTTICPSSIVTDGAPVNQPSGSLPANQPAISSRSGVAMITTLPLFATAKRGLRRGGGCHHVAAVGLPGRGAAGQRRLDGGRQALQLRALARLVPLLELGQHLAAEELQRLADVLVPVASRLADEDDLVDAHRLVPAQERADLVGRADGAAQGAHALLHQPGRQRLALAGSDPAVEAELRSPLLELIPDVGAARDVLAVHVVVAQRVAEEVAAVQAALDGRALVRVAHERRDHGHLGVDGEARRHALARADRLVVVVHPFPGGGRLDEGERQRADALAGGQVDRLPPAAGDPERRVGLLV